MNLLLPCQRCPRPKPPASAIRAGAVCAFAWLVFLAGCHDGKDEALARECINNLKLIESAKMFWALENQKSASDLPADADLFGPAKEVKEKPKCPKDGVYTLGTVGQKASCTEPGHVIDRVF